MFFPKNKTPLILARFCASLSGPFHLRYKSVSGPFPETDSERIHNGFTTEGERRHDRPLTIENFSSEKTFSQKPYTPTSTPHITHTYLERYKDFKYALTLH